MGEDSADVIIRQILRRRPPRIAGSAERKRSEAEIDEMSARTVEMIGFFRSEIYDQVNIEQDECGEIVATNNPNFARGQVLINLDAAPLQDEILDEDEFEVFFWKPFAEWPENLQNRLIPFGAGMIQKAEDPNAQFKESAPSRKAIVMQSWSYPDGAGDQLLLKLEEAATKGLVWRNSQKNEELQRAGCFPSSASSFLAEAHDAGMPLSVSEAIFLAGIQSPADGIARIPKELLERLQKHGVANCTHHPDW